jgi:hypothetical protein
LVLLVTWWLKILMQMNPDMGRLLCDPEPNIFRVVYMDVETRARQVSPGVVGWRMARHPWFTRPLGVGPADNARPGGQGSATGIGTGLGPWDGTHSFESKVQGPRSKVFGPLGSEAVRGERARGVRLNLPHLTWGPGRDTGWDGTSISSHCHFVARLFHHTVIS